MRARTLALAWLASAGCAVADLDLAGKECPCADGYVCDTASNTCVAAGDAPPGDAGAGPDAPSQPRILVSGLKATWTTANAIRWDFVAEGDPTDFAKYEVVTGPSDAAVRTRAAGVRVWGPDDNPELGAFAGRNQVPAGQKIGLWTVTDEHGEGATVFAQVVATDKSGATSASNVASAKTPKTSGKHIIFSEADIAGTSIPTSFARSQDRPYKPRYCYAVDALRCPGGDATCFLGVEKSKIDDPLTDLPDAAFGGAFLEIAVAGKAAVPGYYSTVGLAIGSDACATNAPNTCRWRYTGWTFRAGDQYRLLQVPLSQLRRVSNNATALTVDELKAKQSNLYGFFVQGTWTDKAAVRVDEISVRW